MLRRRVVVAALHPAEPSADPTVGASRSLWREGREVIHLGCGVSAEAIVATAVQEDVDEVVVVGGAADVTSVSDAFAAVGETEITVRSTRRDD